MSIRPTDICFVHPDYLRDSDDDVEVNVAAYEKDTQIIEGVLPNAYGGDASASAEFQVESHIGPQGMLVRLSPSLMPDIGYNITIVIENGLPVLNIFNDSNAPISMVVITPNGMEVKSPFSPSGESMVQHAVKQESMHASKFEELKQLNIAHSSAQQNQDGDEGEGSEQAVLRPRM